MSMTGVYMAEILSTLDREEVITIPLHATLARVAALKLENRGEIVKFFEDHEGVVYELAQGFDDAS